MPSRSSNGAVCVAALCLALLHQGGAKVAFPDSPRAPTDSAVSAVPAARPESRLLADTDGTFGLLAVGAAGQTRSLGLVSELGQARRGPDCPLCHPSVYSYCGDRLLHDACCCLRDNQPLPRECELADCSFLHAKSCGEHGLITRCCCDRRLF